MFPGIFGSNSTSSAGVVVTAELYGPASDEILQRVSTSVTADADGAWQLALLPMAHGTGYTLRIAARSGACAALAMQAWNTSNAQPVTGGALPADSLVAGSGGGCEPGPGSIKALTDVAFGEVWLCAGQSNIAMSLNAVFGGQEAAREAIAAGAATAANGTLNDLSFRDIRVATVGLGVSTSPATDAPLGTYAAPAEKGGGPWARAGDAGALIPLRLPAAADSFGYFSAVCYFFAVQLHDGLRSSSPSSAVASSRSAAVINQASISVPVGVITAAWGGQPVEAFMSPEVSFGCLGERFKGWRVWGLGCGFWGKGR